MVNGVQYGGGSAPPNAMTSINYYGMTETHAFNAMAQMTRLTVTNSVGVKTLDMGYNFPAAGSNAGKISSDTDYLSGETVTYAYDSLNRLLSANSSAGWNQNFGYDGFGNLVSKTGANSPALSVAVNAASNQIVGQSYDANGNQLTAPGVAG